MAIFFILLSQASFTDQGILILRYIWLQDTFQNIPLGSHSQIWNLFVTSGVKPLLVVGEKALLTLKPSHDPCPNTHQKKYLHSKIYQRRGIVFTYLCGLTKWYHVILDHRLLMSNGNCYYKSNKVRYFMIMKTYFVKKSQKKL